MNENMQLFINEQILSPSIEAAFQHAKIYKDDIPDDKKSKFRHELEENLQRISLGYKDKPVTEEQHINNLENLRETMTTEFNNILYGDKFRVGIAQKALIHI